MIHIPTNKGYRLCKAMVLILTMLILNLLCTWATVDAQIYRWQDENGHWHYSDSPTSDNKTLQPVIPSADNSEGRRSMPPVHPPAPDTQGGLLWKISKGTGQPSYLLGTIHSADPRVTRLKPTVSNALDSSARFIMEMKIDTNVIMQFGVAMMMGEGEDLEAVLGKKLFSRVVTAMAGLGMPEMVVHRLKPWVVMAMLSMPPTSGGMILDMVLHQRATGQGKPATGLETAAEQLAVFESSSRQDQVELLKITVDQLPAQADLFEQLIEAYAADDLNRIARIAHQNHTRVPSAAVQRFMQRLNDERNIRMVKRMIPYLEQTNSFIAVGALHLAGDKGVLNQLRRQGYTVMPMR